MNYCASGFNSALTLTYNKKVFFLVSWGRVRLGSLRTSAIIWNIVPARMYDDECGSVGGMIARGKRGTRRKLAPVPLCALQIPRDVTRTLIRAAALGNKQLTA
jgi:hypothetical protein